ncbi:MAG: N-carbamoylputrescine amidase [Bacillota bacterium]|nr:N-carbamoylputrescine amidase [Bacillota bacterium]
MRNVTFAATQMACTDNVEENLKKAETMVRKAKAEGADVILIQELFSYLYFCQVYDFSYFDLAHEEENDPVLKRMAALAKELEVVLPVSFFEKSGNVFYNAVVIFDADGKRLGKYRKSHIPDDPGYYEKFYFSPGDTGFKVWNTKYCKLGVGICWDQWFPEAARCMCLQGAEALLYPTAIGTYAVKPEKLEDETFDNAHWQNTMLGHAAANMVPVLASNRVGTERIGETAITFYGSSFISDEYGRIVEELDTSEEAVILHTFDLDLVSEERREHVVFRDRRPELYKTLLTLDGNFHT